MFLNYNRKNTCCKPCAVNCIVLQDTPCPLVSALLTNFSLQRKCLLTVGFLVWRKRKYFFCQWTVSFPFVSEGLVYIENVPCYMLCYQSLNQFMVPSHDPFLTLERLSKLLQHLDVHFYHIFWR